MGNPKKTSGKATKQEKPKANTSTPKQAPKATGPQTKVVVVGTAKGPLRKDKRYKLVPKLAKIVTDKGFATFDTN